MSNARLRAPLERRLVGTLSLVSIPPVGLIVAYVLALVRLPDEQLWIFLQNAALGAALVFAPYTAMFSRMYRRIDAAVDACLAGDPDPGTTADAFRDLVDLPRFLFVRGVCMWFGASTLVVAATLARADDLSAFTAFALFAGMVSGGFVLEVFLALVAKRIAEPERLILARFAGGPEQRASLVQPLRLERKLRVSLVGVLLVTIGFALQFAQARAARSVESAITQVQHRLLDELPADAPPSAISRLGAQAVRLGVANEIVVIGASGRGEGPLRPLERAAIEDSGAERGDGSGFDSSHVHAWRRLADGRVVVLAQPWRSVAGGVAVDRFGFALVLLVSAAVAVLLARLLASDVSRALRFLDARAQALAEGDLRQADVFESEDELGALARRFEGMAASLRGMVSGVAATAERLDLAASALGESSDGVAEGTAQQLQAIRRAGASTERILGSVGGIASSAEALTGSVEDSASTVHELGAVGGQLGTTAGELSGKVDSVSSAVEQMAASIREVARSADALAEASTDTSSSMEAMASSLGEVESNAGEAAELSSRAVAAAERGRERVAETVAGMEEIRGETEMARQVIGELGTRAEEIGGILEVIRDVADETSLLALNAAIISAQAGEHGRAFAVVADQIKALADRVLVSTREIEERIRGVQSQTSNAVAAIERGVESVHVGVERSQEAGQSLGEITGAAREAGSRIDGIVTAMREQSSAAGHVVKRMEEVETGAERIRRASREQDRGNELILNETVDMRSAALRVQRTTDEQQAGTARIRDAFEGVRLAVEQISEALRQQQEACTEASGQLDEMGRRSDDNQASVARSNAALRELRGDAEALRAEVRRFRL